MIIEKIFVFENMVIYSAEFTFFLAVDCGPLSGPMSGSFSGNSTVFPNSVLLNCDPGFYLNGSTKRTCQPNGTWSGFLTVCSGRSEESVTKHSNMGLGFLLLKLNMLLLCQVSYKFSETAPLRIYLTAWKINVFYVNNFDSGICHSISIFNSYCS